MDGKRPIAWAVPNSMFNPNAPVNLLCVNVFHYDPEGHTTGHEIQLLQQCMQTSCGKRVSIAIDASTRLPLMCTKPMKREHAERIRERTRAHTTALRVSTPTALYVHTHLNTLTTEQVALILNNPTAEQLNQTLRHGMIEGLTNMTPLSKEKSKRADAYWAGKMTSRNVPRISRRPANVVMSVMSHIVSDIGVVPVKDRHGNKFFVMYKCMYTQFRVVHRLKTKDEITRSWQKFIADFGLQNKQGNMKVRVRFLVTDDDKSYVRGKLAEYNKTRMITNWAIAPYTHNANPAESEMRRVMENAVCALYSSGLPPQLPPRCTRAWLHVQQHALHRCALRGWPRAPNSVRAREGVQAQHQQRRQIWLEDICLRQQR